MADAEAVTELLPLFVVAVVVPARIKATWKLICMMNLAVKQKRLSKFLLTGKLETI